MASLVLFDIDRTLISAGGAGGRAIRRSLDIHMGLGKAVDGFFYDGKTDPRIMRDLVEIGRGTPATDEEVKKLLKTYVELLPEEMAKGTAILYKGVIPLLDELKKNSISFGLLTGNIEDGARIKLGYFNLFDRFPFGAFGSDSEIRNNLPPIALKRAEKSFEKNFSPSDTVVIGDSTADVECGLVNNMKVLAVATGRTDKEKLINAGAHAVLDNLDNTEKILKIIKSL